VSNFSQFSPYIIQQSNSLGVPPAIGLGLFDQESGFNPSAIGDNGAAVGIGQLHLGAASDVGVTNRLDPYQSITGSLTYLKQQFNRFGNWTDALAAYNQGAGGVSKGLGYAQSVLQKAQQFISGGSGDSGGGIFANVASGAKCAAGDPVACMSLLGKATGVAGGDGCGTFDFICKLRNWISQSSFFERLALATLALLLVLGGLYLMKGSE
jgi:hypothetical protein